MTITGLLLYIAIATAIYLSQVMDCIGFSVIVSIAPFDLTSCNPLVATKNGNAIAPREQTLTSVLLDSKEKVHIHTRNKKGFDNKLFTYIKL